MVATAIYSVTMVLLLLSVGAWKAGEWLCEWPIASADLDREGQAVRASVYRESRDCCAQYKERADEQDAAVDHVSDRLSFCARLADINSW